MHVANAAQQAIRKIVDHIIRILNVLKTLLLDKHFAILSISSSSGSTCEHACEARVLLC